MKAYSDSFLKEYRSLTLRRRPDFENLLKVLARKVPDRYTLFEFYFNPGFELRLSGSQQIPSDPMERWQMTIQAFHHAGYDYATIIPSDFKFPNKTDMHGQKSMSINEEITIADERDFEAYLWPNPEDFDFSRLENLHLPEGMKFVVQGPGGVMENLMFLMGYDNLCYTLADNPELVGAVCEQIGKRVVKFYEIAAQYDAVGALISNDDWGFNTQTMLSLPDMRKYIFPWHKKIVTAIHAAGKPAILHSCGYFADIVDDIADDMGYDGRHSYEDKILPVEQAYEQYHDRFAIIGGIDVDFVCRSEPKAIYERACRLLEQTEQRGGFALGTGNSLPAYVPTENFLALIAAATANE